MIGSGVVFGYSEHVTSEQISGWHRSGVFYFAAGLLFFILVLSIKKRHVIRETAA